MVTKMPRHMSKPKMSEVIKPEKKSQSLTKKTGSVNCVPKVSRQDPTDQHLMIHEYPIQNVAPF